MSAERAVLLTSRSIVHRLEPVLADQGTPVDTVMSLAELEGAAARLPAGGGILLCANSGVIVPGPVLEAFGGLAYNFHAAPPEFPGRDPHHFGVYRQAVRFGATAHRMTGRVDEGPIVGVEYADIPSPDTATAGDLYALAQEAQVRLFQRLAPAMIKSPEPLPALNGVRWGGVKTTRRDFLELCRVHEDMDRAEFELRARACAMPGYANLFAEIHGRIFRITDPSGETDGT